MLNRTARVMSAAHGGQILASAATALLLVDEPPPAIRLTDLGHHRLRDLQQPERLTQLAADGLLQDFPPVRSLDAFAHNLPVQRSGFVGREQELSDVVTRLRTARLLTVAGMGGCGKTRLALEAAAQAAPDHPDGTFFVDLAPLADGDLVATAIAGALGIDRGAAAAATGVAVLEDVVQFLSRRKVLLVVDNCEHLVDDVADVVDELLTACRGVTVMATSREALSIDGEHVYRVPSLPATEAAALFVDRAAAVDARFDAGAHRDAIGEICERLDGIPLAIELAAAQVAHLSPREIAGRLDDRFSLLAGGRRRVQRQATLEAALQWSHDLLPPEEQMLLRRLSVFAGRFELGDAEAVAGVIGASRLIGLVASLVDKSLVVAEEVGGYKRFRLLETVRLYAANRLHEAGESDEARTTHRDHFLRRIGGSALWHR